jgi:hypothetical protein
MLWAEDRKEKNMTAHTYTPGLAGSHGGGVFHPHPSRNQVKGAVAIVAVALAIGMRYALTDGLSSPVSMKADQATPVSCTQDQNAAPPGIWVPRSGGPVGANTESAADC